MEFDWRDTERKQAINLRKHGVDLRLAETFDFDMAAIRSVDFEGGEERIVTFGFIAGDVVLYVLVYTERGEAIRPISLRRAEKHEQRWFYEQL